MFSDSSCQTGDKVIPGQIVWFPTHSGGEYIKTDMFIWHVKVNS